MSIGKFYSCNLCESIFKQRSIFYHMKTKHEQDPKEAVKIKYTKIRKDDKMRIVEVSYWVVSTLREVVLDAFCI